MMTSCGGGVVRGDVMIYVYMCVRVRVSREEMMEQINKCANACFVIKD